MFKRILGSSAFLTFVVWIGCFFFRISFFTWRKKVIFHPDFQKIIDEDELISVAFWHQDIFASLYLIKKFKIVSMASDSKDGELITRMIEHFGGQVVRGSSRRGAIKALKAMLTLAKTTRLWTVISVDGPIGPRNKAKSGIIEVSRIGGSYIVPLGIYASKKWVLTKTWDQTEIPKFFSRVVYYFGPPIPPKTLDPKSEKDQNILSEAIMAAQKNAMLICSGKKPSPSL